MMSRCRGCAGRLAAARELHGLHAERDAVVEDFDGLLVGDDPVRVVVARAVRPDLEQLLLV
jgi:hypothetical protein